VARQQGRPEAYPVKTRKLKRSRREHALLWLRQGDAHWLVQRPAKGVWAGLWSLPEFDSVDALRSQLSGWPGHSTVLPSFTHVLTHLDLALSPVVHELPAQAGRDATLQRLWPTGRWVAQAELAQFGLPAPVAKLLQGR
jgi:A/G-specific adenine glycosylase